MEGKPEMDAELKDRDVTRQPEPQWGSLAEMAMDADGLAAVPNAVSFHMPQADQVEMQRLGVVGRFKDLVGRIPLLTQLAAEEGITAVSKIEDIGKRLMPHSAYKSYPLSFLE